MFHCPRRNPIIVGPLSLPPVPGSGSTFVEPASCKAKLDYEPSPERAGLCSRSRKSWLTVNQAVIVAVSSCDLHCSGIACCLAAALIAALIRFCHSSVHSDSPLSCYRCSKHAGFCRLFIVFRLLLFQQARARAPLRKGH